MAQQYASVVFRLNDDLDREDVDVIAVFTDEGNARDFVDTLPDTSEMSRAAGHNRFDPVYIVKTVPLYDHPVAGEETNVDGNPLFGSE